MTQEYDFDLDSLLQELEDEDTYKHDTIRVVDDSVIDDIADFENVLGGDPLDEYLFGLMAGDDNAAASDDAPAVSGGDTARVEKAPAKVYPAEPEGEIDPAITLTGMMSLIIAEINRKKIAGHHLDSMNSFNKVGIKQIATKVFVVEGRMKNLRDKTDEDRDIAEIAFTVNFTDINLTSPTTVKYKSGSIQMLTPSMARIKNLTYSAQMYIDATITAVATYSNGSTKTRTAEIKNHRIASVPCPVGSELCNTYNCSKEALKELEEDPQTPGGYFIIKGFEWCVDNLENVTNNTFHVYKNTHKREISRGMFLSKPGDAFENSYQIILRYMENGAITLELTSGRFDGLEIPYYIIFRALGMTRDREIVSNIVYKIDQVNPVVGKMLDILERAFEVDDAKFGVVRRSTDPAEIISFIAQKITDANTAAAKKDDNIAKYLNTSVMQTLDRCLFPHIGTGIEHRIKKLRFLGHLINKLLRVYMGALEQTDRDSYRNKRIFAAGTSMAKSFKTDFNFTIVKEVKRQLTKDFNSTPFSQVQLAESVKAAINSDSLERMLTQRITSGSKTIKVKRNEVSNRISSQMLYHKNDINVKSTLNTINAPNTSSSKQNERADEMRRVHATYTGFIDISQSADTGEKVGMTKQMACTASVCGSSSSFVLKRTLMADPDIIPIDDVSPEEIVERKLAKIFVNGDWIGCCEQSHAITARYREARRHHDIHHLTTILWYPLDREILFWVDVGRIMRPLVIVYNNIEQYNAEKRAGGSPTFKQWIKLTDHHIRGLQAKSITMDDLRRDRIIEYISPGEQENMFLATDLDALRKHSSDIRRRFTHVDIRQAIFGIVTLAAPMGNHSNAVRNTMYTNHRKQSVGWAALNFPTRIDKNFTMQHYCERPLVSVISDMLTYPNGQNIIIAVACYSGYNQEDSLIMNQTSIDRGMFNASHYNQVRAELEKNENFGDINYARTVDVKRDADYSHIVNGFIKENTRIKKGTVLISKYSNIQKPDDDFQYIDKSVKYNQNEVGVAETVINTRNEEDVSIAKVKLRFNRPIMIGDKGSSRTGNKGILAATLASCDMPYFDNGVIPDALINPASFPTRMAINQTNEAVVGTLAAITGAHIDATTLADMDIPAVVEELKSHGVLYGGHQRAYCGRTGVYFDTLIFGGPNTYQRLQKFVVDEHYAMRAGPTSQYSHQPLDGKNNDGGLRLGEMEKDCIAGAGAPRVLDEKFYNDSDGIDMPVCRVCNNRAIVNEKKNIYRCKTCGENADIARISSSWTANLFMSEAAAMNVKMGLELAPHVYSRIED